MLGLGIELTSAVRRPLTGGIVSLPVITLGTSSVSHAEGASGTTTFAYTVTRTGDLTGASSAAWAVTGSGANPANAADFVGGVLPSGTVNFAAGASTATITVNVAGDSAVETDESFTVTLSSPVNATLGATAGTGTITNDDSASAPVLSFSTTSLSTPEGNTGTTNFVYTVLRTGDTTGTSSASWAVTGSGGNPAVAADFVGGVLPSGTVSFAPGDTSKTITVAVAGDSAIETDEAFTVTLSSPVNATLGTATAAGTITNDDSTAPPEIWIGFGDSLGVGIDPRDPVIDLDWPNVYQVRQRAPVGISSDITPLDQAIAPDGTNYLSSNEYFAKQRAADIGAAVYLVPHNYNGSRLGSTATDWGAGTALTNGLIARANAAIQTVLAAAPNAVVGGFVLFEGTNDATINADPTTYNTNLNALIAAVRSGVFLNGVSGATAATKPIIINGLMPEDLNGPTHMAIELKLRETAATITNGKFYKMPEGIARTQDNIHPNAGGMRVVGPAHAALLKDTTEPVITPSLASYTQYAGQKMLIELTADKYVWWTLSNTTDYELFSFSDNASGIGFSRLRWFLRWIGDGTKGVGTYSTTLTAKDASGNVSTLNRTDTVVAAYGSQPGTITKTAMTMTTGAVTSDMRGRTIVPVSLGAGMNCIELSKNSGSAPDIASVTYNGIVLTRDPNSGATTSLWYLPSAIAQSGNLVITPTASTITSIVCINICITGTQASPASSSVIQNGQHTTPHITGSLTCPSGGIIIGGGIIPSPGTVTTGETELNRTGNLVAGYRTTDGAIGAAGTNNGFSALFAAAFAPA